MKKFLTLFTALLLFGSMTVVQAYTFSSGTKIYYNLTEYGGGINPYAPGSNNWEASTANIIEVTLNSSWTVNAGTKLFKSGAGGNWADRSCSSAPTAGQNMIISTDGINVTWGTYVEPTPENYTIYFKNNPGWSTVYIHLYGSGTTFGGNGVGGEAAAVNATMSKIDAGPFWKYEYSSVVKYTKVCFTKDAQNNYGNFWQTECSWSDGLDFDNEKVLWIPNTASSSSINSCSYFNTGAWSEYPPVTPIVSFSGLPATVGVGQQVTFAATSENVNTPTYTFYVKKGSGSYGSAVTSYTFAEANTYTIKVEVRSNGAGDALATREETITCNPSYTIYFKNTPGWTNVYAHLYPGGQTFGANGVGGQSAEINAAMTKIDDGPYWKLEYNSATKYTKVCFTRDFQDGYENFWETQCSWSTGLDFDQEKVLWIPSTASSSSINSCTYYNTGEWSVYPPLVPGVAFSGVPTNVYLGQQVTFAANAENVNTPTYTYKIKIGEGEYAAAANPYTFNAAGSYTVKVEVRSNGAGEVLASAEQAITCLKYSLMQNNHEANNKGSEVAICSSTNGTTFTATWNCPAYGTYYFYVTTNTDANAHTNCDYLNGSQTFENGVNKVAYLYGNAENCYGHSYTLNAPRAGVYTFTLTLTDGNEKAFKCDYPEAEDAEVNLDALPEIAYINSSLTLADYVGSVNVVQPAYTFYVKKGEAAYGSAVTSYTFDATGEYTIKAEVREQGSEDDALDDVEKVINIYEPLTLYFLNKNDAWTNIHAYAYLDANHDIKNADWTGEEMIATGTESNHGHDVYYITIPAGRYDKIVFNKNASGDGNQTSDLSINAATPYYFDGQWYATLDAADPIILTTNFYLAGSFNDWNTTSDRFMKATEDATTASVSVTIDTNNDQLFKVMEGVAYCGATSATIDKDHTEVTIAASGSGDDITLKPFALGEYTFTMNLSTRKVTVTYPTTPTVFIEGLENSYLVGESATLSAVSNLTNEELSYQVKIGEGDFVTAANPYQFTAAGHYTFKVLAHGDEGDANDTKEVTVYNPLTLYFVNKEGWEGVNIYFFSPGKTDWPGDPMTNTGVKTEGHNYDVYSFTIPEGVYSNVIFNGSSKQTVNLTIDDTKHYFLTSSTDGEGKFQGEWKATLAEIDPAIYVNFDGVAATVQVNTPLTLAATSNVENPTYNYYVKPAVGDYAAITSPHTFDALGTYTLKVEALENGEGDPVAYNEHEIEVYATHTFHNGDVIKVDFSLMTEGEKGVDFPYGDKSNTLNSDANGAGTVKTVTFTTDVTWSTLQNFIKTEKGGWDPGLKFQVPVGYQNIAKVAADGASFYWTLEPAVNLIGLADAYIVNDEITLNANSNLTNVSFAYQVKVGESEFEDIVGTSYTFDAIGEYTLKVTATGDEGSLSATKTVNVYNPLTLYFVNKEGWSDIHAYAFGANEVKNANWPGETMTATGESTTRHTYAVYSITIPAGRYTTAIFNNGNGGSGNQTENMTIDPDKPYYYDGEWYATLAECDQPVTKIFLVGSIMGWDAPNAYRFMKENEDSKEASVTVNITEYSDISFKLVDNGNWRGCNPQKTITKDDNTVTILADASGENVLMTPYAAGDYIFTIDLDPESDTYRQITVSYPAGEPMPIPQNIFLACDKLNNWAPANPDYKFTVDEDLATLEVTLAENTDYAFKLVHNGSWYGANYNFNYYWNTDVQMVYEETQANLNAFKAGTYTFEYTISTNKLTIHFKETDATEVAISQYEYATLYSATGFDVPDEVEAYIITGLDGIHLTTERIYRIPANTGVLLHAPQGNYDFYEGDSRYMGVDVSANMMKGTVADQEINNELVHYILSLNSENVVGLYWPYGTGANYGVGTFENKAGKAYLEIPAASQPQSVVARRGFPLSPGAGMPTGIEMTNDQLQITNKRIVNGQLYIILDGATYNAQGARVQ